MNPDMTIPLLPCKNLRETLDFYRALGFSVTHEQEDPYLYGAVQRGEVHLHFANLAVYGAKSAFGAALFFVDGVRERHEEFADGLRQAYGRVPTAGCPRISRMPAALFRFKLFDPSGNLLIVIDRSEPEPDYTSSSATSPLTRALESAVFLRDTYANDEKAANVLAAALERHPAAPPGERALVLACMEELGVALCAAERVTFCREELARLTLSSEDRQRLAEELGAGAALELWIRSRRRP
jgi:catechol 2,3-dioxygenase-like lactoylglutathione lyase family enzyme